MQAPRFRNRILSLLAASLLAMGTARCEPSGNADAHVPARGPRTWILPKRREAFREYCTAGAGARAFGRIRADFDRDYLRLAFPAEPLTYGDPEPSRRTSDRADRWRAAQDVCGQVAGVAQAATLLWLVSGEEKYLEKAREFLVKVCAWHFAPDWKSGPVPGATDIDYNDEAHFRLWRTLPLIYDQIRDRLGPDEKQIVLAHFKTRGERSVDWIKKARVEKLRRNSLAASPASHPVRFMAMTGLSGLALWDDLPEAREWWRFAYYFYRDQFSPWGGADGGWAEGNAYWRGTMEHAVFEDALLAIGDPLAYASPFWRNSPYFALYNVQPYLHTVFGDTSNAGRFNLEPVVADYLEHMARVLQNGHLRSYAALCRDPRPRPEDRGLVGLDRIYPTVCELLVRDFNDSAFPMPALEPGGLPQERFFSDVGWVSMHSALGRPDDDIQVTFKSSPYGSFSHSHADQNAFILNAYGEGLAINSAYREYHRSPFHKGWTWQTRSKNAILIDGQGQKPQDKLSCGKITRFKVADRYVWATGDATAAYQTLQPSGRVARVTRDLVFVDRRYLVVRDRVSLATPARISWLLHAERNLSWDGASGTARIRGDRAALIARVVAPEVTWIGSVTDQFPLPVDPKYTSGEAGASYVTARWSNQSHLTLESARTAREFTVFAVLWPDRSPVMTLPVTLNARGELSVTRPDGRRDLVRVDDESCEVRSPASPAPPAY